MATEVKPKINCKECLGDRHETCLNPETCRCADPEYNHGIKKESLKDGVKVKKSTEESRAQLLKDAQDIHTGQEIDQIIKSCFGDNNRCKYTLLFLIEKKKIISRSELDKIIIDSFERNELEFHYKELIKTITFVFNSNEVFTVLKNTAYELGEEGISILLDRKQTTEVAYWILGKFSIKRIDLTGDLLFFNGKYYEKNAEILVRRHSRECLIDSTNGDMNEIVKYVEDKSNIITFDEIAKSAHLKCFLNGIYNIKTGEFNKEFSKENIILQQIPHNFNTKAKWKKIEKVVSQILTNEKDKQMFYDQISLCLHPYNGVDMQYGGIGQAGTGKNQLVDLVILTLGSENVSDASIHSIANDMTIQKDVAYKMANIDGELSSESIKHIDTIKKWITQDPFTGRGIYEHSTTFRPSSRLFFMANELYEIPNSDDADAIYDRTYLAKINNRFRHTKKQIVAFGAFCA